MDLGERLQLLRKQNGYSQEELANRLGIARQTVSKWENGQAVPELNGLMLLSELYGVTIDRIVKEDDRCNISLSRKANIDSNEMAAFLIRAKRNTYAGKGQEIKSSRRASHDFSYEEKDYAYYDTYLGGNRFAGEEAVWHCGDPVWSMNYVGRILGDPFNADFLKEVLCLGTKEYPYRGPEIYMKGDYRYHCKVDGGFFWYQGYEEIFYLNKKIYECYFHGGALS